MRYAHFSNHLIASLACFIACAAALPAVAAAPPPVPSHCRVFSDSVMIDGARQRVHGMACRRSDGSWQVVPPPLMKAPLNSPYGPVTTESISAPPPGTSNAAAYFYSPAFFNQEYPYYCSARPPVGNELGWPGFYPNASIVNRSLMITTNMFGFPIGPTVVAVAPPAFALVNPHGGAAPHGGHH